MTRVLWMVLVLSSCTAGLPGPLGPLDASSPQPAAPIPLVQLCEVLASGTARLNSAFSVSVYGGLCNASISDDDLTAMFVGDSARLMAEACSNPDGGPYLQAISDIARAEQQGRMHYDPVKAGECLAGGRGAFARAGGIVKALAALRADAGVDLSAAADACDEVFVGHQQAGQACLRSVECASHPNGVSCSKRVSGSCEGVCVVKGGAGQECDSNGHEGCAAGLSCIRPGMGTVGVCAAAASAGQPCNVDGGAVGCASGATCQAGTCVANGALGADCSTVPCVSGLSCTGTPKVCTQPLPPLGVGGLCYNGSSYVQTCERCLVCGTPAMGAQGFCVEMGTAGQSCDPGKPCQVGLSCASGTCVALSRRGQACVPAQPGMLDDWMRGTCLGVDDACMGSPATCQARAGEGQACTAQAGDHSTVGTCFSNLRCARESGAATTGTCVAPGAPGDACGNVFNLHAACRPTPESYGATCSAPSGGTGVCLWPKGTPEGQPCNSGAACVSTASCQLPRDGGLGICEPLPAVGERCNAAVTYACLGGYCTSLMEDGGYVQRCVPYRAENEACAQFIECGPTGRCIMGHCLASGHEGEPCTNGCAADLECVHGACRTTLCGNSNNLPPSQVDSFYLQYLVFYGLVVGGFLGRRLTRRAR